MPRALVLLDSKVALKLESADALLGSADHVKRHDPLAQTDMRALEDRAHRDGKGLAAVRALVKPGAGALAVHGKGASGTTMAAGATIRPPKTFEVFAGSGFVKFAGFCECHDTRIVAETMGMSNA